MGTSLADNGSQGGTSEDHFGAAAVRGLGRRICFLRDGSTTNLPTTVTDHLGNGSEATEVNENSASIPSGPKQYLLNFLR
jgi:hypothetical protein